jgi:hypothetical protein
MNLDELNEKIKKWCRKNYKTSALEEILDFVDFGFHLGLESGHIEGYNKCLYENVDHIDEDEACENAWEEGRTEGYNDGYADGKDEGYEYGRQEGYDIGYKDAEKDAECQEEESYNQGYEEGYNVGLKDGGG